VVSIEPDYSDQRVSLLKRSISAAPMFYGSGFWVADAPHTEVYSASKIRRITAPPHEKKHDHYASWNPGQEFKHCQCCLISDSLTSDCVKDATPAS